jgi:hypothetical protein
MRQIHAGCARHIREFDANVALTCRARSAQQGMLLLDPSVNGLLKTVLSSSWVKSTGLKGNDKLVTYILLNTRALAYFMINPLL